MAVYNVDGNSISTVYNINGTFIPQAYDIDGNALIVDTPVNLRLMQYNVGQWYTGSGSRMPDEMYSTYSALQESIISSNAPDIVTFQEYVDPVITGHSVSEMIGQYFEDYEISGSGMYFTRCIYTKSLPLGEMTSHIFSNGSGFGYMRSTVQIGTRTVHVFCTHWENDATKRAAHALEMFNLVSDLDYFLLMGDLNTTCMSVNDSDYTNVIEQFVNAGYHLANCSEQNGFFNTWFAGHNFETVDYESRGAPNDGIITSGNITINNVYRDQHKIPVCESLSTRLDHAPLVVDVTIN